MAEVVLNVLPTINNDISNSAIESNTPNLSESSPNSEHILSQEQLIVTQPLSSNHEIPDDPEAEENRRRNDDCCCAPYEIDEYDIYFLCRCIAWCCVRIGECTEACFDGCGECITSCCESNGDVNSGDADCCSNADGCDCDCSCFD
ncbi:uncharacterized protein LOC123702735 [Colias croceus]|uniref:uncharacterized protein LOC123702735 n=1 Tax=Colias crocea TaxID=72248 RepID=UPI001E27C290|nr:uncharacterized protein LOC123702735 [Colias croceus]